MKVLLMGHKGNMGARYRAVLDYLRVPWVGYDLGESMRGAHLAEFNCDRVLIATPTQKHATHIEKCLSDVPGLPILCEKPITKNLAELRALIKACAHAGSDLRMMYQYKKVYKEDGMIGPTHYDFFKHGSDGLEWDCMQIIGLARTTCKLSEVSPIWSCAINGQMLRPQLMDVAYVDYVSDWLRTPSVCVGPQEILEVHEKVSRLVGG